MNKTALLLILTSCFMHATWNLLARHRRLEAHFFWRMVLVTALVCAPPAAISEWYARSLTPTAWICLAGSGACCGVYFFALAQAYASSDFTVVYPVARALPVLLVALGDVARGRWPMPAGWLGMTLVVAGCFLVPLHSFRDFRLDRYLHRSILWMFLTALGTVGYSLLDKLASEVVSSGPATAARYDGFFFLFTCVSLALLNRLFKNDTAGVKSVGWKLPIFAGAMNFGAYWLVLWAYQLALRASYVVAFRQFSIIIGVVAAFAIYKEKGIAVRVTGAALATIGLFIIGMFGA